MTEEMSKVLTALSQITGRLDLQDERAKSFQSSVTQSVEDVGKKVEALSVLINGNGEPERGIVVRLDRLCEKEKRRENWLKASITASVGAIFAGIWALIKSIK